MPFRRTLPAMPPELLQALAFVEGALPGWEAATEDQRRLYARWVAQPWTRGMRAARAADTATWAAERLLATYIRKARLPPSVGPATH